MRGVSAAAVGTWGGAGGGGGGIFGGGGCGWGFPRGRRLVHGVVLAGLAVLFAVACNVLRISAGAACLEWWSYDLINGWKHETIGLIVFGMCVVLVLSADQLLMFLTRPVYVQAVAVRG